MNIPIEISKLCDVIIDSFTNGTSINYLFEYDQDKVSIYCQQYYKTEDYIAQFWIAHDDRNIVNMSVGIEYINHISPIGIELSGVMKNQHFPGGQFIMDYKIFDKYYSFQLDYISSG